MLHTGTVEKGTLDLLKKLSDDENLKQYNLVGGTALSLLIGHRKSIDIDLFSTSKTDANAIAAHLQEEYNAKHIRVVANAVFAYINDVKIDMIPHPYVWLAPPQNDEGIRIASLDDIAATKVNAIVQSGQRLKDFADMHFILEHRSMDQILQGYVTKYPDGHAEIAKMALLYHKQIDFDFQVRLIDRDVKWREIKDRLKQAVLHPGRLFSQNELSERQQKERQDKTRRQNRGRRR